MKGGKVDQDRPRQKPHMRAGDFSCSALFELQAGKELSFRAARACCHKLPRQQQPASSLLGGNGEKLQGGPFKHPWAFTVPGQARRRHRRWPSSLAASLRGCGLLTQNQTDQLTDAATRRGSGTFHHPDPSARVPA